MKKYPNRQIHLDFHTSAYIDNVGERFNKEEFGRTLSEAGVKLVNLFGKCHHGYYYYPSQYGEQHPKLSFNLLEEQIEACKSYNIEYTIYTCVGWNEMAAKEHPEWLEVSPDGLLGNRQPFDRGYYKWDKLCLNNKSYREQIKLELKEMADLFEPKSFWIDIIFQSECICASCKKVMEEQGYDIESREDRVRTMKLAQISYEKEIFEFVKSINPQIEVFFNGPSKIDLMDDKEISNIVKHQYNSFLDIESLPSEEWGYTHFPISVNFLNKYNKELTMMNGKFHTAWGDFGSLRNKAALEYETFRALAYGAGVCIGDQLHPSGKIDETVYRRIGEVFKSIESKEPWCLNTKKKSEIGVYMTTKSSDNLHNAVDKSAEGVYRMLQELKYQFDFLCFEDSIDHYDLVIVPDYVDLSVKVAKKINDYISKGGAVIFSGHSGIDKNNVFMIDALPLICYGPAECNPRYMYIEEDVWSIPTMAYVMNERGMAIGLSSQAETSDLEVLTYTVDPYFNRTNKHFCSHRQTPPKTEVSKEPAIVRNGNVFYLSNPIFGDFANAGMKVYKDIIGDILKRLIDKPLVKAQLPALCEVMVRSINNDKLIVHILNYVIQRKCKTLDTIEEVIPLYNRKMSIRMEVQPRTVRIVPELLELEFYYKDEYVHFTIPEMNGHTMVEIF